MTNATHTNSTNAIRMAVRTAATIATDNGWFDGTGVPLKVTEGAVVSREMVVWMMTSRGIEPFVAVTATDSKLRLCALVHYWYPLPVPLTGTPYRYPFLSLSMHYFHIFTCSKLFISCTMF